jgi:hypothetical protein
VKDNGSVGCMTRNVMGRTHHRNPPGGKIRNYRHVFMSPTIISAP